MRYYESEQYSPDCLGETNSIYNYPTAYDEQNCSMDYEMLDRFNEENRMPVLCPVRPNSLLGQLPCKTNDNWDYNRCYSYFANGCYNTCQFVNVVDIEDFM